MATVYRKTTDLDLSANQNLGASKIWVFIDERQDHINWGNYCTDMTGFSPADPAAYQFVEDMPGINHNNGCGFGFADGHAEVQHGVDARTCPPISNGEYENLDTVAAPRDLDIAWLQDHSTRPPQ
jgi:prepilin-type processing-associated H-X9-DG protein